MPSPVPTPVAAAIGLVPAVLGGVRRLPGKAVQLPVLAVSSALTAMGTVRREYDDLADRGERLIARLRGSAAEELEEAVDDVTGRATALAEALTARAGEATRKARDVTADAASRTADAASRGADLADSAAATVAGTVAEAAGGAGATAPAQAPAADSTAVTAPKAAPTPRASEPDSTRIDTAATPEVVATVEQAVSAATASAAESRGELPLPDYDHMTLGSLRGRLRSLDVEQLVQIRQYEKQHADRLPVVTMLDNRIAKLATDAAAAPTGNPAPDPVSEQQTLPAGGSPVTPATSGPAMNPPSQGVPTNPAQPRS